MTMPESAPAPAAADAAPAAPPAAPVDAPGANSSPAPTAADPAPGAGDDFKLHPSWEETLDAAGIPDLMRKPLIEKIRNDERAVQQQIEAARGTVPPEWKSLLEEARQANVSPKQLVDGYNALRTLREDPIAFQQTLNAQIDAAVQAGHLTRAEGQQAKQEVQQQVDDAEDDPFSPSANDPVAKEVAELKRQLQEREQREQQEREQWEEQQRAEQEAAAQEQWLDNYFDDIDKALSADETYAGLMSDTASADQAQTVKITVARLGSALIDGDPTLTTEQAISGAIAQLKSLGAAPRAAKTPPPPVGGGGNAVAAPSQEKMTEQQREKAMIDEAMRQAGLA